MLTQFVSALISSGLNELNTGYIAEVVKTDGDYAFVRPKSAQGTERAPVRAIIPQNIKSSVKKLRYVSGIESAVTSVGGNDETGHTATTTVKPTYSEMDVYAPAPLAIGDIVYVGVSDNETQDMGDGTERIHDINNSVILCVI